MCRRRKCFRLHTVTQLGQFNEYVRSLGWSVCSSCKGDCNLTIFIETKILYTAIASTAPKKEFNPSSPLQTSFFSIGPGNCVESPNLRFTNPKCLTASLPHPSELRRPILPTKQYSTYLRAACEALCECAQEPNNYTHWMTATSIQHPQYICHLCKKHVDPPSSMGRWSDHRAL